MILLVAGGGRGRGLLGTRDYYRSEVQITNKIGQLIINCVWLLGEGREEGYCRARV